MPNEEKIKIRNFYRILEIASVFVGIIMAFYYFYPVFASPPSTAYAPGETTDPSCSPGDTNCTVYPPLTTTLTTSTAIIIGTSSLRFAYDSTNYTSLTVSANGAMTVSSTGGVTTTFATKISFLSNAYFNTVASGTWNGNVVGIAYGGTNSSTLAAAGSIIYSDGTRYNASAVGNSGQILQSGGSGIPVWVTTTTMGFVNLQGATSGAQQTGNLNISGTGLFGTKVGINSSSPIATLGVQGSGGSNPFSVNSSTGSSLLTVLQNGNVGIGTEFPSSTLEVAGGAITVAYQQGINSRYSTGASTSILKVDTGTLGILSSVINTTILSAVNGLELGASGVAIDIRTESTAPGISFSTASTERLRLQNDGRWGFNSSSPKSQFVFQGLASSSLLFDIASSSGDSLFRVLANGNVGIGTSTPSNPLAIQSDTAQLRLSTNSGPSDYAAILGANYNSAHPFSLQVVNAGTTNEYIGIYADGGGTNNRIALLNGNVGVGTTTPIAKLTVHGTGNTSSTFSFNTFSASGTSTFKVDNAGNTSFANDGLYYEASSSITYINSFETGGINFDDNAGFVSWVDMEVSSTVAGTPNSYTASIDGNPMIQVYADSNGSGGVANMTVSVGTSTTSTYKMYIDAGVSTTAGLGVNGYIKASGYISGTTTLDIAETYPVDPECDANGNLPDGQAGCPQVGDVVCSTEDASSTFFIEQCSAISAANIIGVVSENPGFILGGYDVKDTKIKGLYPTSFRPIALAGRVSVNVSIANGPIKAGDYLTSSEVPGVAVKSTEPGKVIGTALQSFDGISSATGTIKVFVNTSWSLGSAAALTENEENVFPDFAHVVLDKFTLAVRSSLRKLGLIVKDGVATVKQLFADKIKTDQLCVGETCINEEQLQDLLDKTSTQAAPPVAPVTDDGNNDIIETSTTTPVSDTEAASSTPATENGVFPADSAISESTTTL